MSNILAISGKKGSGKTTSSQFLMASTLASLGVIDAFKFETDGTLIVKSGDDSGPSDLLSSDNQKFYETQWLDDFGISLDKTTKVYYFADDLKQKVCIDILGLSHEQCYGSEADKNTITHLKWQDMPEVRLNSQYNQELHDSLMDLNFREPGFMTAREVMQYVGTEIFRRMCGNVWVDSTVRRIQRENTSLAVIGDCRFVNEVVGIQEHGGKVVRLLRNPYPGDIHPSETGLDDFKDFDHVIDNTDMTIQEANLALRKYLESIGWWPEWRLTVDNNS